MTAASRAVERLISYSWNDWIVSMDEANAAMSVLRTDPHLQTTIRDLHASGMLSASIARLPTEETTQLFGGACEAGMQATIRNAILLALVQQPGGRRPSGGSAPVDVPFLFDVSFDIQNSFRRMGARFAATPFNQSSFAGLIPTAPDAPFSGLGATGVSPTTLSVPLADQGLMLAGHQETTRRYDNPVGDLFQYLGSLSARERRQQAALLLSRPIASLVPHSYGSRLPSRAAVVALAAQRHRLSPALLTAFLLSEARDQSQNEDAKDLEAALSPVAHNSSIGLGQIVISTARREDLFSDLLSSSVRGALSQSRIARLLTSDELNIFGVAKYVRIVADRGARSLAGSLPNTLAAFPGLNLGQLAAHSSSWSDDTIRAVAMYYTSRAWTDDLRSEDWGHFVFEAFRDVRSSGVFPP